MIANERDLPPTLEERKDARRSRFDAYMLGAFLLSLLVGVWIARQASPGWALALLLGVALPAAVFACRGLTDVGPRD